MTPFTAHLPAFIFLELYMLTGLSQQLLYLEHIARASIGAGLQRHLSVLRDPLIHCLGNLQANIMHAVSVSNNTGMVPVMFEKI